MISIKQEFSFEFSAIITLVEIKKYNTDKYIAQWFYSKLDLSLVHLPHYQTRQRKWKTFRTIWKYNKECPTENTKVTNVRVVLGRHSFY